MHALRPHVPLVLLAAAPLLAQEPADPSPGRAEVCEIEVLRGRARVFTTAGGRVDLRRAEPRRVAGRAHLEVPAGSQVRVRWLDSASLSLWGPSALEWSLRSAPAPTGDLPRAVVADLEWTLFDLAWMDLEVRRGAHVLRLPGDWRADLGACALHLRGLPTGPIEVRHHAGQPMHLRWLGDPTRARPPVALYAGSTLRIDQPLPSRPDAGARAEAWDEGSWPWRVERDTPADRAERVELGGETTRFEGFPTTDPRQAGPVNSVRGFPDPTEVRVELVQVPAERTVDGRAELLVPPASPQPRRTPLAPLGGRTAPQRPRPETVPGRPAGARTQAVPEPAPAPGLAFDPAQWRDHGRDQLARAGALAVELRPDVEVRVFASGRYKVFVDALSQEGAWCFAPDRDWWLEPGAVVVFEPDGALKLRFGKVEQHDPLPGRPAFTELD